MLDIDKSSLSLRGTLSLGRKHEFMDCSIPSLVTQRAAKAAKTIPAPAPSIGIAVAIAPPSKETEPLV